jgi:hypothetical protein
VDGTIGIGRRTTTRMRWPLSTSGFVERGPTAGRSCAGLRAFTSLSAGSRRHFEQRSGCGRPSSTTRRLGEWAAAWELTGGAYRRLGEFDRATYAFRQAMTVSPTRSGTSGVVDLSLAEVLIDRGTVEDGNTRRTVKRFDRMAVCPPARTRRTRRRRRSWMSR